MESADEDVALMTEFGAIKIQSLVRMLIVRSKLLKQINARYEKIYDPNRERYYYYDRLLDQSSWGKPPLLLNSDIAQISPLYVEGDKNNEQLQITDKEVLEKNEGGEDDAESVQDEDLEKSGVEESSSDESSVDSATARERRRLKRRYPR